jgi:hypothetical protein
MSLIVGARGIGDWTVPDERELSYHEALFQLCGDLTPFFGLTSKLKKQPVTDFVYKIFEEGLPVTSFVAAGCNSSVTTIPLSGTTPAKGLRAGMLLRNMNTGEILRVAADPTTPFTGFTCDTRGSWGGGSDDSATITASDILRVVGTVQPELTTAPTALSDTVGVGTNYLQDFQETCEVSDWGLGIKTRLTEKKWAREKRRASERFSLAVEMAMFFGKPMVTTIGGKTAYTTGGISNFVKTNVFDDSSTGTSLDRCEDIMQQLGKYGSPTRFLYAGAGFITRLNRILRNAAELEWNMGDSLDKRGTWGINVKNLETPHLELQIVKSPLLTEDAISTNMAFILDLKNVARTELDDAIGPVHFDDDIKKDDGYTGRKGRWRGVLGLQLGLESTHGIWTIGSYKP